MKPIVEIKNLDVEIAGFSLRDITMEIPQGAVTGLIGRNGAGKTTLIKTLTDIYAPTRGEILYGGLPMRGNEAAIKAQCAVVYDSLFYPVNMKALNVMKLVAPMYPDFDTERWHTLMKRMELPEKKRVGQYSKGMQMRFMLVMALARNPKLLILDEQRPDSIRWRGRMLSTCFRPLCRMMRRRCCFPPTSRQTWTR